MPLSLLSGGNQTPRRLAPIDVSSVQPTVSRIDAVFRQSWREKGLVPSQPASELAIARRISLGLTGTIPSLEEIRQFESWPQDDRVTRWLAATLTDRRYADFVAERLARAYVGTDDGPFLLYRRRRFVTWLSDQMAANVPYDEIVTHLIADSGLWTDTPATNFVTATIQPGGDTGPDPSQLAARVARAFLGIRLDCAECHDHPFDRWKQQDFQSLAAFFGQTRRSLRGITDGEADYQVENRETGATETVSCRVPYQNDLVPADGTGRERLAAWVTNADNRPFAREAANRAWALLFGRPLVEPIDDLPMESNNVGVLDILADDFVAHGYDLRRLLEVIGSTEVFQLDSRLEFDNEETGGASAAHAETWAVFPLTRLRPEQIVGALLQSASLSTIDSSSHIVVRLARAIGQKEFVERYGDSGAEEFETHGGTIPQRLLMMNGEIVFDKTKENLVGNAATRIAALAPDDDAAIETAMLTVLTRRPDDFERRHFVEQLSGATGTQRNCALGRSCLDAAEHHRVFLEPLAMRNDFQLAATGDHALSHRRALLKIGGLGGAAWLTSVARLLGDVRQASAKREVKEPSQSLIVLWMAGGPSQLETFDPHAGARIAGETRAIATAARGVQLAEGLEQVAQQMESIALVRSLVSKEGDHERGTYLAKTGYRPDPTAVHPSIGAICCHELPLANTEIPRHISILPGQWPARGGFLGDGYDAFKADDPVGPVPDVLARVAEPRVQQRLADLEVLEQRFARGAPR